METIEVIVFLTVSIIIGFLLLYFFSSYNYSDFSKRFYSKEPTYKKVDKITFAQSVLDFWDSCGMGEKNKTLAVFVDDNGPLNKSYLFSQIKKINLCQTLQSALYDCGNYEHVVFENPIQLPHVVRLQCNSTSQKLSIVG